MSVSGVVKTIQDIMRRDEGDNGDAQRIQQMCWLFFLKIIDDQVGSPTKASFVASNTLKLFLA